MLEFNNDQSAMSFLSTDGLISVIDFGAKWCKSCPAMERKLKELENSVAGASFVKIDVEKCPQTALSYQVQGLPTVVIYKDGTEINRLVGTPSTDKIESFIRDSVKIARA
jgi:thioredoxin-like negative regulator of GroEL